MTPQDRAEAFIGRLVKAIRMPRLPNPVHKMPQGTGLGPIGAISRDQQRAVNARATSDTRSSSRGAEPVQGGMPPDHLTNRGAGSATGGLANWRGERANEREMRTRDAGTRTEDVSQQSGMGQKQPRFPKNPKRRHPAF